MNPAVAQRRDPIDLLIGLNYYAPYVSGLTDTAKVVAEGLAAQGWKVTVVAARHDNALPPREELNGVTVLRTPVVARFGKGVISPTLPTTLARLARRASVLNLHLPMLEAGLVADLNRSAPLVVTYQCDVTLHGGVVDGIQERAMDLSSARALRRAAVVVPSSDDYAEHSRVWRHMAGRTHPVSPPSQDRSGGTPRFREGAGLHVGFLGRIVAEKGLDYLVDGFLAAAGPEDRLLIGGDYAKVAGGSVVDGVRAKIGGDRRVRLLGFLPDDDLADFYASLDVFVLPSVNPLEAFGIVQVEAMIAGVPVIASDLPGVRTPVQRTGFGLVVPPRDPAAIAAALVHLSAGPQDARTGSEATRALYGAQATITGYCELFESVRTSPAPRSNRGV